MTVSVIPLPINAPDTDPSKPTVEEAAETLAEYVPTPAEILAEIASKTGNIAARVDAAELVKIGIECVDDYERDKKDREEWEKVATESLDLASQEMPLVAKGYPWPNASNVSFPILATAALQFNARMYPAVVKGDEAVLCKVIGQDNGRPLIGPDGQPVMRPGPDGQPQPVWIREPQAKARRARRVSEYLNTTIFYRMDDWEGDMDALLLQLPIVGCVFKKLWWDADTGPKASMVSALRIFVPQDAKSTGTTPRLTEEIPSVYPHQISADIRSGHYLDVDLYIPEKDEERAEEGPRMLLEQHRLIDLDEDGVGEPYIVTVDHETNKVLRIEPNFGPQDIRTNEAGDVVAIDRGKLYIKYDMFPHPKGKFYGLGLGHLLRHLGSVINTSINQLIDAGRAQTAGGGFIGSGVRLQARGGGSVLRYEPGKYFTVDVPGGQLRDSIVERTLPQVSEVTYNVLDLILGAAKDIAGSSEVLTGDASNNGQVGTTLALIEQGLQVFNATAKRTFRALKEEYTLLKDNIRKYGGEAAAKDYLEVLDDPEADFEADFNSKDMDIRPVSDPSSVTRMQKMAKGQFVMSTMEQLAAVGGDAREALRRVYEAADVEDIDKLLPPPPPQQPDPMAQAAFETELQAKQAQTQKDSTAAVLNIAKAKQMQGQEQLETARLQLEGFKTGTQLGQMNASIG